MHLNLGPVFCFLRLESPQSAALSVAVVAGGLMTITSFVTDMTGNVFVHINDLNMDSTSLDVEQTGGAWALEQCAGAVWLDIFPYPVSLYVAAGRPRMTSTWWVTGRLPAWWHGAPAARRRLNPPSWPGLGSHITSVHSNGLSSHWRHPSARGQDIAPRLDTVSVKVTFKKSLSHGRSCHGEMEIPFW